MEKLEYEGLKSYRSFIECFDMGELDFFNLPDLEYFELVDYMGMHKLKKDYFQKQITSFVNRIKSINENITNVVPTFNTDYPLGIIFNNKGVHLTGKENGTWKSPICNCDKISNELDAIYNIYNEVFKDDINIKTASLYFSIIHSIDYSSINFDDIPIIFIDDDCNILSNKETNKKLSVVYKEKGYKKLTKKESEDLIKKLYIKA